MYDDVCVCIYIYIYIYIYMYTYTYTYTSTYTYAPFPPPNVIVLFWPLQVDVVKLEATETKGALPLPLHQAALRSLAYPRNWHHLRPQAAFRDNLDQRQEQGDIDPDKLEHYMVFVGSK